jgi:hypothetical protein
MGLKADLVEQLARALGIPTPAMSTGSTEPKAILTAASDYLGLGLDARLAKPRLAEAICGSAGVDWDDSCWSSGSTVTVEGLRRVGRAVCFLKGDAEGARLF